MMMEGSDWLFSNGTVDWADHMTVHTDTDLAALLGHMCVAAQRGVERLTDQSSLHQQSNTNNNTNILNTSEYFKNQEKGE